jgi:hypothetical protein
MNGMRSSTARRRAGLRDPSLDLKMMAGQVCLMLPHKGMDIWDDVTNEMKCQLKQLRLGDYFVVLDVEFPAAYSPCYDIDCCVRPRSRPWRATPLQRGVYQADVPVGAVHERYGNNKTMTSSRIDSLLRIADPGQVQHAGN